MRTTGAPVGRRAGRGTCSRASPINASGTISKERHVNDPRLTLVKDDGRSQEEGAGTLPDRHWHELGEEPDYRFSLANERTFLAWIRTALALMAAAVGVTVVRSTVEPRALL